MLVEFQGAMASMVSLLTISKGAIEARDWTKLTELSAKFNEQIIKTQQAVIDAQGTQTDFIAKLAQANQKIRELEATIAEQARHHLEEITPGKFALRVQLTGQDKANLMLDAKSQPKHYACQRCFAITGKSIILQFTKGANEWTSDAYLCPACNTSLAV